jgi:hypothetical protein
MNVLVGKEAAQFYVLEYIYGIIGTVCKNVYSLFSIHSTVNKHDLIQNRYFNLSFLACVPSFFSPHRDLYKGRAGAGTPGTRTGS